MPKPRSQPDHQTPQSEASTSDTPDTSLRSFLPSNSPGTNLLIADIVVRGASTLFRKNVEKRVARASAEDDAQAQALLDGRTLVTTLALYGASKVATRSPLGLAVVAGGLVAKTLYDRGKARQQRRRRGAR